MKNAVQYYLILDEKMHAFVPKHYQNLLYKPNKPDREEQISVAMLSLPPIYNHLQATVHRAFKRTF